MKKPRHSELSKRVNMPYSIALIHLREADWAAFSAFFYEVYVLSLFLQRCCHWEPLIRGLPQYEGEAVNIQKRQQCCLSWDVYKRQSTPDTSTAPLAGLREEAGWTAAAPPNTECPMFGWSARHPMPIGKLYLQINLNWRSMDEGFPEVKTKNCKTEEKE